MSRWMIIAGTVWLVAASAGIACAQDVYVAQKHMETGDQAFDDGDYKQAAQEYESAWKSTKTPRAAYNLGRLYDAYLNNNALAVKYYEDYLTADPQTQDEEKIREWIEKAKKDVTAENHWRDDIKKNPSLQDMPQRVKSDETLEKAKYVSLANVCLSCHEKFLGPRIKMEATHPVDRIPKGELDTTVPKNVRFYREGRVVCLSCHNPTTLHFEQGTPGFIYKYLRVDPGPKGEEISRFCAFCHSTKSSSKYLSPKGSDDIIRRIQ